MKKILNTLEGYFKKQLWELLSKEDDRTNIHVMPAGGGVVIILSVAFSYNKSLGVAG